MELKDFRVLYSKLVGCATTILATSEEEAQQKFNNGDYKEEPLKDDLIDCTLVEIYEQEPKMDLVTVGNKEYNTITICIKGSITKYAEEKAEADFIEAGLDEYYCMYLPLETLKTIMVLAKNDTELLLNYLKEKEITYNEMPSRKVYLFSAVFDGKPDDLDLCDNQMMLNYVSDLMEREYSPLFDYDLSEAKIQVEEDKIIVDNIKWL